MINKAFYFSSILFLFFTSCSSEQDEMMNIDETLLAMNDDEFQNNKPKSKIVYSIPSPNEQYDLLHSLTTALIPTVINPLSNSLNYSTNSKKALNFGVYISDVAYLMRYDQGRSVFLDYVSTLEKLGQDLDITKVYGEELINQVDEEGTDTKRLFKISSENYFSIYDQLIENKKGLELSLILSGSWIETMHILFTSSKKYNESAEVQGYIIDQRLVLENLIGFVESFGEDERIDPLMDYLRKIGNVYKKLKCEDSDLEIENSEGTVMLTGGTSCKFTSNSYIEMKSLIMEIRTSIIS